MSASPNIGAVQSLRIILRMKWDLLNNHVAAIKSHLWIHLFVGLGVLFILVGGGLAFFHQLFSFLMGFEPFGPVLMERLTSLVFMAFFAMLVFSNLVITLTTTYISREIDFHMCLPMSHTVTFASKLVESIIYSSWAFVILSFPLFVAYGLAHEVQWHFYILIVPLVVPFIIIPAGLGALVTMVISALLPARRSRVLGILFGLSMAVVSVLMLRILGGRTIGSSSSETFQFNELLNFLNAGSSPLLPSLWLAEGLHAAATLDWHDYIFWSLMLISTAMMAIQACLWLIPGLYYRGWCLTRETSSVATGRSRFNPFALLDRALGWMPTTTRAFIGKDARTFWRDPAQWSQLIMLLGLLTLYIANIRNAAMQSSVIDAIIAKFQNVIAFFNLGATCFILSILTTRFIYPMLSLEGKQFWIVGLAPLRREAVVWEKYWVCLFAALVMSEPLVLFSAFILGIAPVMTAVSVATIFIMAFGLTSLAVGLGAIFPNFNEDNPARIANGLGGTLNVILSLVYIGAVTMLMFVPARLADLGQLASSPYWQRFGTLHIALIVAINVAVIVFPMWLGLRNWKRMEF